MNKEQFAALMSKRRPELFRSKAAALRALDAVLDSIAMALKRDRRHGVHLVNFGTFKVKTLRRRKGSHPRTKQPIVIAGRQTVKFACGKGLRESITRKSEPQMPEQPVQPPDST